MNYTDSDIRAIVDTQVELKTKEIQNINDKLSNVLTSAETKIDKAINFIDMVCEIGSYSKKQGLDYEELEELYSILKGEDNED